VNERVWLDEQGIIRLRSTPRQQREIVNENVASIKELIKQQQQAGRPVLLLIDLTNAQQVSLYARRAVISYIRLGVDRFALYGRLPHLEALMFCLAKLAGYKNLRVFPNEQPALDFLLAPPAKAIKLTAQRGGL